MGPDSWNSGILDTINFSLRQHKFELGFSRAFFENAKFWFFYAIFSVIFFKKIVSKTKFY